MKKLTKRTINYLSQWIGHEIIRIKPTCMKDWSYTDKPILLVGFTPDGCIRYQRTGRDKEILRSEEDVLSFAYTDRNWITVKKAKRAKNNRLNQWRGKAIKHIRPTPTFKDKSYTRGIFPTLISASKHHVIIMSNDSGYKGEIQILRDDWANAEDWALAE